MSCLRLHDFELDEGCYAVRLLLAARGLNYERIPVNLFPGREQARPPLLDLNPLGTLPILEDLDADGTPVALRDAGAILAYLAHRYDPARTWLPVDPVGFGHVMQWLAFAGGDLRTAVAARRNAIFGEPADAAAMRAAARCCLRTMDDHMTARGFSGAEWFVGAGATIADLAVFPSFALSRDIGIDHEAYPALRRWMRRVRTIPGFTGMPGIPDYH